jgi:peroxiredoxin
VIESLLAAALLFLAACAGSLGPTTPVLDLKVSNEQGRSLELAELRGRPSVLFLFTTYDATSQLALTPLILASQSEDRVTFIGIAVQPDARVFLGQFKKFLEIPFALYIDDAGALLQGTSALGKVPGVPAYVALDAEGHVRKTFFGIAKKDDIEELVDSAL